jgi:hypothetical protein
LGGGDDRIDLPFQNDFNGPVTFQGGQESDTLDGHAGSVFTSVLTVSGFEVIIP